MALGLKAHGLSRKTEHDIRRHRGRKSMQPGFLPSHRVRTRREQTGSGAEL